MTLFVIISLVLSVDPFVRAKHIYKSVSHPLLVILWRPLRRSFSSNDSFFFPSKERKRIQAKIGQLTIFRIKGRKLGGGKSTIKKFLVETNRMYWLVFSLALPSSSGGFFDRRRAHGTHRQWLLASIRWPFSLPFFLSFFSVADEGGIIRAIRQTIGDSRLVLLCFCACVTNEAVFRLVFSLFLASYMFLVFLFTRRDRWKKQRQKEIGNDWNV